MPKEEQQTKRVMMMMSGVKREEGDNKINKKLFGYLIFLQE